jgi:predicted phosphoribosyltransferase
LLQSTLTAFQEMKMLFDRAAPRFANRHEAGAELAPVGSAEACRKLEQVADDVVCARIPPSFSAVGEWYDDFSETSDEQVHALVRPQPSTTIPTGVT